MFDRMDGAKHPYMASSAACWAAYGEVLAREYTNRNLAQVHRLSVDAYAVQHPGGKDRQSVQSVGLHLVRLCLLLEHNLPFQHANDAMLAAGRRKSEMSWLAPPPTRGDVTVKEVLAAQSEKEHRTAVQEWARSAYGAWADHLPMVRGWAAAAQREMSG